ncbi:trypsin-like serine protease [Streptomyces sp. NPDC008150]|uniref:S1 family peptidase n=1 Tax=Streptomyces sp. NPDC008150 TaxID=3364816 RepID=UPI0036E9C731
MGHARRRVVRRTVRLAAAGGLILGGVMVTRAAAGEPAAGTATVRSAPADSGAAVVQRLGAARTAGTWTGSDGRTVVAVTDTKAADTVRRAGLRAERVSHSTQDLTAATAALAAAPRVAGTAWSLDYPANEVVVLADGSVSAADWSRLGSVARAAGSFVRMERTAGSFTPLVDGAEPILSTAGRCSAGFNVTNGQADFVLTAGHCGPVGSLWFTEADGTRQLGRTVARTFPGKDFSLVRYANGRASTDTVATGKGGSVTITGTGEATVGQRVSRSGSTSGLRTGRVTAVGATVNYPEGTVTGLIQTSVCAEPGDSGGPLFAGGTALGVTSGGNGDCAKGGTTFFQPVGDALTALGVHLVVAAKGTSDGAATASPAASATATAGAAATGDRSTGLSLPRSGDDAAALASRLAHRRNIGPGLLVAGGSLVALVAARWIRDERDRRSYRRSYSTLWS